MQKRVIMCCVMALMGSASLAQSQSEPAIAPADAVYSNGFVYTADSVRMRSQALAVRDGKFVAVGANEDVQAYVGPDTRTIDLQGNMVMPGLVDTHIHAVRGALTALGLAFPVTATVEEIQTAIKGHISDNDLADGDWLEGAKWSLDPATLNAAMLDEAAPNNPVFLHDWTNHLVWVNSAALEAANITKNTPDPAGGLIERDADGNPTGVLHDKALGLVTAVMPPPTVDQVEERAGWIFNRLNGYGITGIVTAQMDQTRLDAYRAMEKDDLLTVRIQGSWDFNTRYVTSSLEDQSKTFMDRDTRGQNSDLINVDGVKIYMDGIPDDGEGGAPMIDSYATAPTFGRPSIDESTFSTWMMRFDAEGLKVMAHATGSLSVRHFLNAVEATRRANGAGPRHHLAHSMLVYPDEISRFEFGKSNMIAEFSPYQLWVPDPTANYEWPKIIGRDLFDETFSPIRSLVDAGAVVTYGSDWDNIPEPDPWLAMEGMITRQFPGHPEFGQFNPDERIDVETAIQIFTRNGAMAMELEGITGTIEPGKSADFIVIDQNLLEIPHQDIHKTNVLQAVLRGHTVFDVGDKTAD